jgi:hypothetical protein
MGTPTTLHAPRRRKRPPHKTEAPESIAAADGDSAATPSAPFMEPEQRHAMISDAAYFLAEQRDFCPGHELDDWLTAERDIEHLVGSGPGEAGCGT